MRPASRYVWLLTAALAVLALFQDRPWKSLQVFDWDGGGYYVYLPAAFIRHDLGRADSCIAVRNRHEPSRGRETVVLPLPNGQSVPKYPLGVALAQLPWFGGAHWYAQAHGDPPTGFSRPYQQAIMVAGLCYALLGLWIIRKTLRRYFDDRTTAWTLAGIGLGTNFFVYASYEAQMPHAYLVLWQAALLYCTARWHEDFQPRFAVGIGLFLGLAILTRPTEALYALVPLAWGLTSGAAWRQRGALLRRQWRQVLLAVLLAGAISSLQLLYWRFVSGHWLVYSYGAERFDFARPHVLEGLFSFRKGWFLYTPMAALALAGVAVLRRYVAAAVPVLLVLVPLVLYVTFSWEQWYYGAGFSARPLVSLYPLLALPLAALVAAARRRLAWLPTVLVLLIGLNLWQTWQYATGALPYDKNTRELYIRNFFRPSPG